MARIKHIKNWIFYQSSWPYICSAAWAVGDRVAVIDRDLLLPPVLVGILKSGAAYVPIDPAYPAQRAALILEDAGGS
ncbi:AMP-binding protein [Chitinophaga sp. MD30]|uniref:AMP-binding protein n=1 Tax=Chitinophaga sp. MD30 TaxID=2033437 RepID=UPI0012FD2C31|nr:AMP-binding protein [Chitinophaga sp. MD30]